MNWVRINGFGMEKVLHDHRPITVKNWPGQSVDRVDLRMNGRKQEGKSVTLGALSEEFFTQVFIQRNYIGSYGSEVGYNIEGWYIDVKIQLRIIRERGQ